MDLLPVMKVSGGDPNTLSPKNLAVSLGDWFLGGASLHSTLRPVIDPEGICGFVDWFSGFSFAPLGK